MPMVMSVVATVMGTDHEAGPEDHRKDENNTGNNHDESRKPEDPAGSTVAPLPVPPRWRFCRGCRLRARAGLRPR
jgi:hypothetical protein